MTADLLTALAIFTPLAFTAAVATHVPHDSKGQVVRLRARTFSKDVRSFLGFAAY